MELVLKEIRNNKKSISIACIQWFITTAISKCTLDIILRFSSTILEYYGDIFMYLDEIIVSPKDLMIYDGATDIAFLGTKKRQ